MNFIENAIGFISHVDSTQSTAVHRYVGMALMIIYILRDML